MCSVPRGLFNPDEMGVLRSAVENEAGVMSNIYIGHDRDNAKVKVSLWNQPGNDVTGIVARSEKLAGTFEKV